ncbi:MAG: hypothetical protein M0023_02275 [Desulfobacteraceae bacterium]|nr:hypothetical protein [Desulfobacteraceae bacterium]
MKNHDFRLAKISFNLQKSISPLFLLFALAVSIPVNAEEQNTNNKVESRYLKELYKNDYSEVKTPKTAPIFRWDFSKKNVRAYSYDQEVINKTELGAETGSEISDPEQSMSAKGSLLINSQADGTAELVLKDMKTSMRIAFNKTDDPKIMEQEMPPFVVQGMKEDGTGPFGDSSQDMLLKLIFPLPTKTLKIGESVDVPAQMPFNAMGSQLQVKGRSRITLTKYVLIGNHTCAQFNVDIDISDLKVPSALEGEYLCSTKGSAVFFFDINSRTFVSGSTALLMQFSIDAPMPKMNIQGEATPNIPARSKMSMKSDNFISVSLQE